MKIAHVVIIRLLAIPLVVGKPCKQKVCHTDGVEWKTLNVGCAAAAAHLGHGDLLGSCDDQQCSDLCVHQLCMNDFEIHEDGTCSCVDNPDEILCGVGAECNMETDECDCINPNQIFDIDGNCIDECTPTDTSYTFHMTFRDDFHSMRVVDGAVKDEVLQTLAGDFPDLFVLAGAFCTVTVTDLDFVVEEEFFITKRTVYGEPLCMATSRKKETHYGPAYPIDKGSRTYYTISAECTPSAAEEYFASFANERRISYYDDVEDTWKYAASDFSSFSILTDEIDSAPKMTESCDDTVRYEPFYNLMELKFSVSHSGFWGGGTVPSSGSAWLPGTVFVTVNRIDPRITGLQDYILINKPDKTYSDLGVPEYKDTASIGSMIWQAKLYNSDALAALNMPGDEFQIYANVDMIEVHVGTVCV